MANRIVVATLYQGIYKDTSGKKAIAFLLNVSPRDLVAFSQDDQVFLTVNLDKSIPSGGGTSLTCAIIWKQKDSNPFQSPGPYTSSVTKINTPTLLGTLNTVKGSSVTFEYTLSITYDNATYIEDPQMQINA